MSSVARLRALVERRAGAVVVLAVLLLAVPYAAAGSHFLADDFVWLRNAHFDGWINAGGPRLTGRPGGWLLTALTYGAIGAHPLVLYLVQTVLRAVVALAVWRCLVEFVPRAVSLAVTLVWIVTANHLALELWLSALPGSVALGLAAVGVTVLARVERAGDRALRAYGPAWLLLAAAVATYELTVGVAALAVVAVPLLVGRRPRVHAVVGGLVAVAIPALWNVTHSTVYGDAVTGRLDPTLVLPGHLALGFAPFGAQGRLVTAIGLFAVLGATLRLAHPDLRPRTGLAERLTVAGGVLIVAGAAPLARFATNFFGLHDRLVLVGGVGAAMVWTGAALLVGRLLDRPLAVAVVSATALVAITVPLRVIRTRDYEDAGRQAVRETSLLAAQARVSRIIEVPGPIAVVDRVWGLNDGWNATAAVQRVLDDPTVVVGVDLPDVGRTGPPPDRPRASF